MVGIDAAVERALRSFVDAISEELPVTAAYLFGSAARGQSGPGSDVDVAIVSERFKDMRRVDAIALLMRKTRGIGIDLQPIGLVPEDLEDPQDTLARAIAAEGIEIPLH